MAVGTRFHAGGDPIIFAQPPGNAELRVGALRAPNRGRRDARCARFGQDENLLPGAADLEAQVGVAAVLPVALVDFAHGGEEEFADHEGRAARIVHRHRRADFRACPPELESNTGRQAPSGGRWPTCGAGLPSAVTSMGATAVTSVSASSLAASCAHGVRRHLGVLVQEEDVVALGGPPAEIHGLGETEIARDADEARPGNSDSNSALPSVEPLSTTSVSISAGAVGGGQGFQAAPEPVLSIVRHHHHRNLGRFRSLLFRGFCHFSCSLARDARENYCSSGERPGATPAG